MVESHPDVDFHFLFDRPYSKEFVFADNVTAKVLHPPARHPFLFYLFFERAVPRYLNSIKPDLFISPDGFLSTRYQGAQLPVFHDLNFMHHKGFLPWLTQKYYTKYFPEYAKKAIRIATVSEYSKQDIAETFNYPQHCIDVVYNGIHEVFAPVDDTAAAKTRQEFTSGLPYFVYIGALHKRKNIGNLLQAFDRFRLSDAEKHKLVIVGEPMFGSRDIGRVFRSMRFKEDVVFVGRQYEKTLQRIVASSRALLLVSHFEGFGIPIIEAMQCEVPVITSSVTSMPEVAGDAALYVDPASVFQIQQAMERIAGDADLRRGLVHQGKLQRERFSWDKTARLLWESVEKCM